MTGHLVRDLLNVPLKVRGKVIGVLGVDNLSDNGGFSENDEYLLSTLADYAAIAIDNASLYELMDRRAEELTQLIAARNANGQDRAQVLSERAEQLIAQASRLQEPCTQISRISEQLSSLAIQLNAVVTELGEMGFDMTEG